MDSAAGLPKVLEASKATPLPRTTPTKVYSVPGNRPKIYPLATIVTGGTGAIIICKASKTIIPSGA